MKRFTRAVAAAMKHEAVPTPSVPVLPVVCHKVKELMRNSGAFRALPPVQRHELIHEMVRIATYITAGERGDRTPAMAVIFDDRSSGTRGSAGDASRGYAPNALAGKRFDSRNFQKFVADLLDGVFGPIVSADETQMEAFSALVKQMCRSIDDVVNQDAAVEQSKIGPATRERVALDRQQKIATMMLMGIQRIVATDGAVDAKIVFNAA
jgi:hypothetical protein